MTGIEGALGVRNTPSGCEILIGSMAQLNLDVKSSAEKKPRNPRAGYGVSLMNRKTRQSSPKCPIGEGSVDELRLRNSSGCLIQTECVTG